LGERGRPFKPNPKAVDGLTKIPKIMRKEGYTIRAQAMGKWFSRNPDDKTPVNDVHTAEWALGFERAKKAYNNLLKIGIEYDHTVGKASDMHKVHFNMIK